MNYEIQTNRSLHIGLTTRFATTIQIDPPYSQVATLKARYFSYKKTHACIPLTHIKYIFVTVFYLQDENKQSIVDCIQEKEYSFTMISVVHFFSG